jgi:EAL domain-containing protein (putative c-di-GMP-specific phosphodiesterase class I)
MRNQTPEKNIKLMRLMKRAIDEDLLVASYHPLLQTRFPGRKTYLLGCHLKTATGQLIPYNSLRKLAGMSDMEPALDRWMAGTGLQALKRMHLEQPEASIIIPQSGSALHNAEYPRWLDRQRQREDLSSRGLVIAFRLSQIARNLKSARDCTEALHKLDIQTMIDQFSEHPAAIKILKVMNSSYITVTRKLLDADDEVIHRIINVCHKRGVRILLPGIRRPQDVNLHWSSGADLLEGPYIHPATKDTEFSFPAVVS